MRGVEVDIEGDAVLGSRNSSLSSMRLRVPAFVYAGLSDIGQNEGNVVVFACDASAANSGRCSISTIRSGVSR